MTALERLRGLGGPEVDSDAVALLEAAGDQFDVAPCESRLGPAVVAAVLAGLVAGFAAAIIVRHCRAAP